LSILHYITRPVESQIRLIGFSSIDMPYICMEFARKQLLDKTAVDLQNAWDTCMMKIKLLSMILVTSHILAQVISTGLQLTCGGLTFFVPDSTWTGNVYILHKRVFLNGQILVVLEIHFDGFGWAQGSTVRLRV
jgi:hypothetical protein